MKNYAIVTSVAHLPPTRDLLSLTALRLFLGDTRHVSLLFADSPTAASAQTGEWVSYEDRNNGRAQPAMGLELTYLPRSNFLANLEWHFPTEVSRLLGLRRFFDSLDLRKQPDERELADIDHRVQKLRSSYNTLRLPVDLFVTAVAPEFRSREMFEHCV